MNQNCCTPRSVRNPFLEMDQIFRTLAGPGFSGPATSRPASGPFMNVFSTDSAYVIEIETPGVKAEDVSVEFLDGELTIQGERTPRERGDGVSVLRRERGHGRFERTLSFEENVDAENIDASLVNGVLTVTVPKVGVQARRIEVRTTPASSVLSDSSDDAAADA